MQTPTYQETRTYAVHMDDAFEYCLSALRGMGGGITAADKNIGVIQAQATVNMFGWPVHIEVAAMPNGNQTDVTYASQMDFNIWLIGRDKKAAMQFWSTLDLVISRASSQRRTIAVEVVNRIQTTDIGHDLREITKLLQDGVLTQEEWLRAKDRLIGVPASQIDEATQLLRQLHALRAQGVLSETEFNMKKWDILSERLMSRDRPRKHTPPSHQPPNAGTSGFITPPVIPQPDALACPLCAGSLDARSLVIGNNTCPHCRGTFEAE